LFVLKELFRLPVVMGFKNWMLNLSKTLHRRKLINNLFKNISISELKPFTCRLQKINTPNMRQLFIEIEVSNLKNIKAIQKKLTLEGITIDESFLPKMLNVAENNKKVFLLKVIVNSVPRKKLLAYPSVINYWELQGFIPFNENNNGNNANNLQQ